MDSCRKLSLCVLFLLIVVIIIDIPYAINFQVCKDDHDYDNNSLQNSKILIKVHGILNGIGWGILMPIGAIICRHLKIFEVTRSTWSHLRVACMLFAYAISIAGFFLGMFLSELSCLSPSGFVHISIGVAVYSAATVQFLVAIFLKPDKNHKARIFWNIFHYIIGCGTIVLSIFNIFKGLSFSNSNHIWRNVYFGVVVSLGFVALMLEVIAWFLFCKRRKKKIQVHNIDDGITNQGN